MEWVEKQVVALGGSAALESFAAEASAALATGGASGGLTGHVGITGAGQRAAAAGASGGERRTATPEEGERGRAAAAGGELQGKGGATEGGRRGSQEGGGRDSPSARSANAAASMVCEMLSTWDIDRGPSTPSRVNSEPNMMKYLAAKGSGFYSGGAAGGVGGSAGGSGPGSNRTSMERGGAGGSGPGSKRTSMEMMRGTGPNAAAAGGAAGASGQPLRRCPVGFGSGGQLSPGAAIHRPFHTSSTGTAGPLQGQGQGAGSGAQGQQGQGLVRNLSGSSSRSAGSGGGSPPESLGGFHSRPSRPGSTDSGSGSGLDHLAMTEGMRTGAGVGAGVGAGNDALAVVCEESLAAVALSETKRRKIINHFSNLQRLYSKIRCGVDNTTPITNSKLNGLGAAAAAGAAAGAAVGKEGGCPRAGATTTPHGTGRPCGAAARRDLESFSKLVASFTKYDRLRVVGELQHSDPLNASPSSSIVSSIEFDMNHEVFATAGVSKRIQFFNYRDVCAGAPSTSGSGNPGQQHSISTRSKLSCLSYNKHVRNHIASSDYEGGGLYKLTHSSKAPGHFESIK
jgi:hypothetical protein